MLYVRFPLSLLNVDDLLHERGIVLGQNEVTYFWSEERSQRGFFLLHSRNTT